MKTKRIIIGYDRSQQSKAAAAWALDEAARTGAAAEFFCAYEWPRWAPMVSEVLPQAAVRRTVEGDLAGVVGAARRSHPDVQVSSATVDADAVQSLVERSAGADLIVLGTHGHSGISGLLGSARSRSRSARTRTARSSWSGAPRRPGTDSEAGRH